MKPIPYSELLAEVLDLVGWDVDEPNAQETRSARRAISNALGRAWRYTQWPDLSRTEQRTFHPIYDPTEEVEIGEFRYFPPTDAYYQALQLTTGEPPASYADGVWQTDLANWSLAQREINAQTWEATAAYAQGDQVYYGVNFKVYQAFATPPVGTLPTDDSYWTEISELDPFIPWTETGFNPVGLVEGIYAIDPSKNRGATPIAWDETANGMQIRDDAVNAPWVRYQLRVPILTGETWDATSTYEAVSVEDTVTVTPPVARGDYASFDTVGEARAAIILASRVDIWADGNGASGTFRRDATYVDDGEDVTGFVDAAGTAFRRAQRT